MQRELTFIHISDVHIGDVLERPILSQIKDEFFKDLEYLCKLLGHIDVVLMTGDLVQTGAETEYEAFCKFWNEVCDVVAQGGTIPKCFFVPGNHDLQRCLEEEKGRPVHQMLLKWTENKELREKYFWEENSDYLNYVKERFNNYLQFFNNWKSAGKGNMQVGVLPGDFYEQVDINGIKLGVIGLNSSFLQIEGGDYMQKLGIYNSQIYALFQENYAQAVKQNDLNFLLTHHAPEWYDKASKSDYESQIYLPDYITEHFCGHNHEPYTTSQETNNAGLRHVSVGPSVCGLEYYEDHLDRIHGYQAGKFILTEDGGVRRIFYPRKAERKTNAGYVLDKDAKYQYDKGKECIETNYKTGEKPEALVEARESENILQDKSNVDIHKIIRPSTIKNCGHYVDVRIEKQEQATKLLSTDRSLWVCSHFGLGEEQFLSSVLKRMSISQDGIFMLDCEDVRTLDELEKLIREHFSEPLGNLVRDLTAAFGEILLVLKNISDDFTRTELAGLKSMVTNLLRFNSNFRIIFISSVAPQENYFESVVLEPLTPQEVKHVVGVSKPQDKFSAVDIDKIVNISNGYPMCLDFILDKLEMVELEDIDESDFSFYDGELSIPEDTKEYIKSIKDSTNTCDMNCYKLLLLLSVLPKGDTFAALKRLHSTSPFKPNELSILREKELVDVDYYYVIQNRKLINQTKVLRIPKIYRDYIVSIEDEKSLTGLYKEICALYLGDEWYAGRIKLPNTTNNDYVPFSYYNVEASLKALLQACLVETGEDRNVDQIVRYVNIAGNYVDKLESFGVYYVALFVARELYAVARQLTDEECKRPLSFLKYKLANIYRMNRDYTSCIPLFKEVIDENLLAKKNLLTCWECLAYSYTTLEQKDEAVKCAKQILDKEKKNKNSSFVLVAKYIQAINNDNLEEQAKELKTLYSKSQKHSGNLKANIARELSFIERTEDSVKRIDKELKRTSSTYVRMQLLGRKYSLYTSPELNKTLDATDIEAVHVVYSFAFVQMIVPLLTSSHQILFAYYSKKDSFEMLAKIMNYSAFVWEMQNATDNIEKYMEMLRKNSSFTGWAKDHLTNGDVKSLVVNRKLF